MLVTMLKTIALIKSMLRAIFGSGIQVDERTNTSNWLDCIVRDRIADGPITNEASKIGFVY